MTDELAGQVTEEQASAAQPPAPAAPDIESLIARKVQELSDQRVAGLQSAMDKKIAALQKQLARRDSMTDAESEAAAQEDLRAELAAARREAEMYKKAREYPDAFPYFERLMNAEDMDAQMKVIVDLLKRAAQPTAPAADKGSKVDSNNPAPANAGPTRMYGDVAMDQSLADRILTGYDRWPGR